MLTPIPLPPLLLQVVIGLSQSMRKYAGLNHQTSTEYAIASRSLGVGLTASGAVSAWCW